MTFRTRQTAQTRSQRLPHQRLAARTGFQEHRPASPLPDQPDRIFSPVTAHSLRSLLANSRSVLHVITPSHATPRRPLPQQSSSYSFSCPSDKQQAVVALRSVYPLLVDPGEGIDHDQIDGFCHSRGCYEQIAILLAATCAPACPRPASETMRSKPPLRYRSEADRPEIFICDLDIAPQPG